MQVPQLPHPVGQISNPALAQPFVPKQAVAYALGVCERTVDRLVDQGLLTRHRHGRAIRFDSREVQEYIQHSKDSMVDLKLS